MNQRERILAILVGGLVVLGIGQWGFSKYKSSLQQRKTRYDSLQNRQLQLVEKRTLGALADRQMGEYLVRSLPSDVEKARNAYQSWLLDIAKENDIQSPSVNENGIAPFGDLYQQLKFKVSGRAEMPQIVSLLYDIQAKDYLHRIQQFDVTPSKRDSGFIFNLTLDAIALNSAPADAKDPKTQSWRVDGEQLAYEDAILNRNLFEPPNRAPVFKGNKTFEAVRGRETAISLDVDDPEKHGLTFGLVGEHDNVTIDSRSGTIRVRSDELQEFKVDVEITDQGFPKKTTKETLLVKVVDPPPPPVVEPPKVELAYDDAKQTYLTGLVQGAENWTAWMNVRTRGKTLKLRVGDEFEIGSVRGKIKSIDADKVEIEIDDKVISLKSGSTLKSAVEKVQ
ncbi:cadherin repeat domain-containing protein [Stieleria sp. JC731]|uniref:cadherin repeat domain-containing protein n=1 Tax=Pirellulaceae TaxID=2691357 RepID=UPI001E5A090F|nr:cadherin repeat domain-containing protein [Stieleria sp. JC731]MCC9601673.1 cadherin repeat domain-containing protein [Stieleria sp. JC731]